MNRGFQFKTFMVFRRCKQNSTLSTKLKTYRVEPELYDGGIVELVDLLAEPERTFFLLVLHVRVIHGAAGVHETTPILLPLNLSRVHVHVITVHAL